MNRRRVFGQIALFLCTLVLICCAVVGAFVGRESPRSPLWWRGVDPSTAPSPMVYPEDILVTDLRINRDVGMTFLHFFEFLRSNRGGNGKVRFLMHISGQRQIQRLVLQQNAGRGLYSPFVIKIGVVPVSYNLDSTFSEDIVSKGVACIRKGNVCLYGFIFLNASCWDCRQRNSYPSAFGVSRLPLDSTDLRLQSSYLLSGMAVTFPRFVPSILKGLLHHLELTVEKFKSQSTDSKGSNGQNESGPAPEQRFRFEWFQVFVNDMYENFFSIVEIIFSVLCFRCSADLAFDSVNCRGWYWSWLRWCDRRFDFASWGESVLLFSFSFSGLVWSVMRLFLVFRPRSEKAKRWGQFLAHGFRESKRPDYDTGFYKASR
jgi:hypothetical protein